MSKTFSKKPLALALGAAFALTGLGAQASVFQTADLASGYMVASAGDEKKGEHEAKCGAKCMEGMEKAGKTAEEAKAQCEKMAKEGKCGEGKCGGDKKDKADKEGKCGEGKCGGKK
jgi:uncharacterized low-complexity protein